MPVAPETDAALLHSMRAPSTASRKRCARTRVTASFGIALADARAAAHW